MSKLKSIRKRLKLTQEELGEIIGCSKGRVSQLETADRPISPDQARLLVAAASAKGVTLTYDDIYGESEPTGEAAA